VTYPRDVISVWWPALGSVVFSRERPYLTDLFPLTYTKLYPPPPTPPIPYLLLKQAWDRTFTSHFCHETIRYSVSIDWPSTINTYYRRYIQNHCEKLVLQCCIFSDRIKFRIKYVGLSLIRSSPKIIFSVIILSIETVKKQSCTYSHPLFIWGFHIHHIQEVSRHFRGLFFAGFVSVYNDPCSAGKSSVGDLLPSHGGRPDQPVLTSSESSYWRHQNRLFSSNVVLLVGLIRHTCREMNWWKIGREGEG